jgi:hypothetical protein
MIDIKRYLKHFIFIFIVVLSSCYKETILIPDHTKGIFNFIMDSVQEQRILNARGERLEIINPIPVLSYYDQLYPLDKLQIRGTNTLNFRRKGFSVNLDTSLRFYINEEDRDQKFKEFKLQALVYDYTYMEYYTGINLFKEVGLFPMYSYLTEVQFNGHTQGVYLFIDDPVEYHFKKLDASVVIRRYYNHAITSIDVKSTLSADSVKVYTDRFNKIYSVIKIYSGKQLFDTLSALIDLENYFTKMSVDMLIRNSDYTDEIFFYSVRVDGKDIFRVIPWDMDDIFEEFPHEIGRTVYGPGNVFGTRVYYSMEDIYADVGHKLIFSIEDDLDYIIAKDEYLYGEYLKSIEKVINKIDGNTINRILDNTRDCLLPFYASDSIIAQSRYDVDFTNYQLFIANMAEKSKMLLERRQWILDELNKTK